MCQEGGQDGLQALALRTELCVCGWLDMWGGSAITSVAKVGACTPKQLREEDGACTCRAVQWGRKKELIAFRLHHRRESQIWPEYGLCARWQGVGVAQRQSRWGPPTPPHTSRLTSSSEMCTTCTRPTLQLLAVPSTTWHSNLSWSLGKWRLPTVRPPASSVSMTIWYSTTCECSWPWTRNGSGQVSEPTRGGWIYQRVGGGSKWCSTSRTCMCLLWV